MKYLQQKCLSTSFTESTDIKKIFGENLIQNNTKITSSLKSLKSRKGVFANIKNEQST